MKKYILIFSLVAIFACKKEDDNPVVETASTSELYYPEINSMEWETTSPESLGWDTAAITELLTFMEDHDTRAFIVLKDGKIVLENYWGEDILNINPFTESTNWYWASAGKTLTAFLVGMAQQEGLLNINDKTSDYLGENWTSMPLEKENLITIKHQLTMTTGMDYQVDDIDCTDPACLIYKEDAGNQWYYHNAPYTLLESVVSSAANMEYNDYTNAKVEETTGINGFWAPIGSNNVYWSTARDAARFGLLLLGDGKWGDEPILNDIEYMQALRNTSQDLNLSYGYLTWLNGKSSVILPGLTFPLGVSLSEAAPDDLYAAMGKDGQYIDVVPSENLVVIRMGRAPDNSLVPVTFHNEMWEKLNAVRN